MIRTATLSILITFVFVVFPFQFVKATNYTNTGGSQSYSLYNGDTLKITSGAYTGSISTFNNNSVVLVYPGATFKPLTLSNATGKIINYGTMTITYSFGTSNGFNLDNYNMATFQNDLSLWNGTPKTINNYFGAKIIINGGLSLDANSNVNNTGTLNIGHDLNLYANSSIVINDGVINVGDDLQMSNGQLINTNRINTVDEFDVWGGQFSNTGAIEPRGDIVFSAGTSYTNSCRLITQKGFTNFGTFQNNGILWVGRTNTSTDEFYNTGTFINGANAKVKAVKMTNNGTLKGAGYLYFTGSTTNTGTVGVSGITTDTIKVDDVTRTVASQIFDTQFGTVYNNAVYRTFAMPDTNDIPAGCSATYLTSGVITLPVKWNYFYAKMVQDEPVLNWSAEYETGMQFEIERSYNNTDFASIKTVSAAPAGSYTYTDAAVNKNQSTVYYRIRGVSKDGSAKYSETKMLKQSDKSSANISVYPNPTANAASVSYTTDKTQQLIIRMKNASGQQIMMKNVVANSGSNQFDLGEVKNLARGIYFVDVISGNEIVATERLVKQ